MILFRKLLFFFGLFCGTAMSCADSKDGGSPMNSKVREAVKVVQVYIEENKKWASDEYSIELYEEKPDEIIFSVIHLDDRKSIVPGGGKSVEVYVDPVHMEITDELHYQ